MTMTRASVAVCILAAAGPDGLLYVALQLPGANLFSSTPGVVVRLLPID